MYFWARQREYLSLPIVKIEVTSNLGGGGKWMIHYFTWVSMFRYMSHSSNEENWYESFFIYIHRKESISVSATAIALTSNRYNDWNWSSLGFLIGNTMNPLISSIDFVLYLIFFSWAKVSVSGRLTLGYIHYISMDLISNLILWQTFSSLGEGK